MRRPNHRGARFTRSGWRRPRPPRGAAALLLPALWSWSVTLAAEAESGEATNGSPAEAPPDPAVGTPDAAPEEVPVALPELLRRAVEGSPPVLAAGERIEAARAIPDQVSAYPVPTVGVAAMGFPASLMDGWEVRYTARQTFPLGDQRERRAEAAWAGVEEASASRDGLRLDLALALRLAWIELAHARADAEVLDDQRATIRRMSRIANDAYAAGVGSGSQLDVLRARAELPMLEAERRATDADAEAARARLAALAALASPEVPADPSPIGIEDYEAPALPSPDELLAEASERRPEFRALEARASGAVASGLAAAEERLPDLVFEGGVQQRIGGNMPPVAFLVGLAITLPWASPDQYAAMEAEANAAGRMVRAEGEGLRLAIEADLRQQLATYERLVAELELERKAVRVLRQAETAAVAGYTAGNTGFDAILDIESHLWGARRSVVRTVHELQATLARIDRIVARPLEEQIAGAEEWP